MREKYSPEAQAVVDASPVNKIIKCGGLFRSINDLVENRTANFLKNHYFAFEIVEFDENRVHELKKLGISVDYLSKRYENIPSSTIEDTFVSITKKHIVLNFGDEAIKKIKAVEEMDGSYDPTDTTNESLFMKVMNKKTFDKEMVEYVNKKLLLDKIRNNVRLGVVDNKYIDDDPSLKLLIQIIGMNISEINLSNAIFTRMSNLEAFIKDGSYLFVSDLNLFNYIRSKDGDNYYQVKVGECELREADNFLIDTNMYRNDLLDIEYYKKHGININVTKYSNGVGIHIFYNKNSLVTMAETSYRQILGQ